MNLFTEEDLKDFNECLTVVDLMKILQVSRPTVMKMLKKQGMPHFRAGRDYIVTKRGFLEYINGPRARNGNKK